MYLSVDSDDDILHVASIVAAARSKVEADTGRALLSQTFVLVSDSWPCGYGSDADKIYLERTPLQGVSHIKYYPEDGSAQATLSTSVYRSETRAKPGFVILRADQEWPALADRHDAVEITFTAGFATPSEIDQQIIAAVKMLAKHWYDNGKEPVKVGTIVTNVPLTYDALIDNIRVGASIG